MKILKYTIAGLIAMSFNACGNDWLDQESSTHVQTETMIKELSDVKFTLNGIYSSMQNAYAYSGRLVYYADATGDDMQAYSSTKRTGSYYMLNYTKDTAPSSFWSYPYGMITQCNVILNKIDALESDNSDLKDYYKGEALALRGMFLFDLTRIYGYPYKKDNGSSLGAAIVKDVLDKDAKPSRNKVSECYDAIIKDLKDAATLMDNSEGSDYHKGNINRWGVLSLLSRVYLYHGDDILALSTAEEAIKGAESMGYSLWTNSEYATAWSNDASASHKGEVLFEIVNTTDDSPGKESLGRLHNPDGYKDICLTSSFYSLLTSDSKDVRNKLLVLSSKRAFVNKYQPQEGEDIMDANIPLLRLSETYLNAAEAAVKTNNNDKAVKYLNAIVNRANPSNIVSGTVTIEQVMTERRKELVGEGHRMFDALRDGGEVYRYDVKVSAISSTKHLVSDKQKMEFNWDYFKCVLALPKAERDANPNIKQNPGYDTEE